MFKPVIGLLLALVSFLLGMRLMSQALRGVAESRLQSVLVQLMDRPLLVFLLGTLSTAVMQSSSAMTVMIVMLVDAKVFTLLQALPLIAGANVGTTITAQLVSFQLYQLIVPAGLIGLLLICFQKTRNAGRAALGLGLVFLGLRVINLCLLPLLDLPWMQLLLLRCSSSPSYAVMMGALVTALVQSSGAVTGIVIGMSVSQSLGLSAALGLTIGSNVGTCATALIASLGSGPAGRRVACAHLLFNLLGVVIAMPFFSRFVNLVASSAPDLPRQIANGHTLFNLQTAVIFLFPLICCRLLGLKRP